MSTSMRDNPVILPPGRARLATRPAPTRSSAAATTMGMVLVVPCNTRAARRAIGHNDRQVHPRQLGREAGEALVVSVRIAPLDGQILSLAVTEVAHALHKGIGKRIAIRRARTRARCQKPDAPTFGILLRTRSNRPGCHRAAKKCDELAPSHGTPPTMCLAQSLNYSRVPISEVARSFCHPCPAASGIGGISKPDVVAEPRGGRECLPQRAAWKPVFVHVNEFLVDS